MRNGPVIRLTSRVARHRSALPLVLSALLALASLRLAIQVPRLVAGGPEVFGAVDLRFRHAEVARWFAGEPVYGALDTAVYPPATYPLLWPLLGWLDLPGARLLWAATGLAALAALCVLLSRASGAPTWRVRLPLAFLPPAFYATGVTLAAGQLLVHLLPALAAAVLLLSRSAPTAGQVTPSTPAVIPSAARDLGGGKPSLRRDLAAAGLFLMALAKPNAAIPFTWLLLFLPRRLRPTLLAATGYLLLTFLALAFRPTALAEFFGAGLATARGVAAASGYGHLGVWLAAAGLERFLPVASLAVFLALGAWVARHRDADPWILLGVTALVARVWTYHQVTDDVMVLLPAAAAYRLVHRAPAPATRRRAAVAFALAAIAGLLPTRLYALPDPWPLVAFELPQMFTWAVLLTVLLRAAAAPASRRTPGGLGPQLSQAQVPLQS
jgi:hypothetical protein